MKKLLVPFLALFFLASCGTESITDMQPDQEIRDGILALRSPVPKINVCKYDEEIEDWVVISVNKNALSALEAQGAVQLIDEDGDGYVTMENGCGIPVDCDDTDPELTDNCDPIRSVTSLTGKIWMDRNLGATQVATSSTDAASYGDLYQWGRGTDGHQIRASGTTAILSSSDIPGHSDFILVIPPSLSYDWRSPQNTNLWQGVNGINNPCPTGYRLPTETEINAERLSWSSNDAAGAFASPLKLPMAGGRLSSTGLLVFVGTRGVYWTSTVTSFADGLIGSYCLDLFGSSDNTRMLPFNHAGGISVRCIKD